MSRSSAGAKLDEARAAYGRAFNRFGLGRRADTETVLADAHAAVGHLASISGNGAQPGTAFIAARLADTGALISTLRDLPDVARSDVATGLLAVDFVLRAMRAQHDAAIVPEFCLSCQSTHLVARAGGTPDGPHFQCTDCGLTAAYPLA